MIASTLTRYLLLTIALFATSGFAQASYKIQDPTAPVSQQVVSGKVKVNGRSVAPGFAVGSGDTVETAKGSSAVVSLGKLGRVEVLPGSKMKVTFDDVSLTVSLESGAVRISKAEGMTATVSTKDGEVVSTTPLAGSFTVDTSCGNTIVAAHNASVELRAGGDAHMVMPGSQRSAGNPRPGCKPRPTSPDDGAP